jgi:nitrite reductase/ring-hydroxylating ferredoxin subunit
MADDDDDKCFGCEQPFIDSNDRVKFNRQLYCDRCFRRRLRNLPIGPDYAEAKCKSRSLTPSEFVELSGPTLSELKRHTCIKVEAGDEARRRTVALVYHRGQVYAIDHFCHHAGGPLTIGDVEDLHVNGQTCAEPSIKCPWHGYRFSLRSGRGIFVPVNGATTFKSVKQRVHQVRIADNRISVKINDSDEHIASDEYY